MASAAIARLMSPSPRQQGEFRSALRLSLRDLWIRDPLLPYARRTQKGLYHLEGQIVNALREKKVGFLANLRHHRGPLRHFVTKKV